MCKESTYRGIRIIAPNQKVIGRTKAVLKELELYDKTAFKKVVRNLKIVFSTPSVKDYNYTDVQRSAWICSDDWFDDPLDKAYLASLLLHESHHVAQYRSGHQYIGRKAEIMAYSVQRKFLKQIGYIDAIEWLDKQLEREWWTEMSKDKETWKTMRGEFLDYLKNHP